MYHFRHDLTNFLRDKESYDSLSSLLNTYGECSGLKLNKDKKEAYWLGSSYRNHEALDINKVNEPIKILGIFFTYDQRKSTSACCIISVPALLCVAG